MMKKTLPFLLKVLCFENLTADMDTLGGTVSRGLIHEILMFFEENILLKECQDREDAVLDPVSSLALPNTLPRLTFYNTLCLLKR